MKLRLMEQETWEAVVSDYSIEEFDVPDETAKRWEEIEKQWRAVQNEMCELIDERREQRASERIEKQRQIEEEDARKVAYLRAVAKARMDTKGP